MRKADQPSAASHTSVRVELLEPSEDFVNLIAEGLAPERYGRAAELDAHDRMLWAELNSPRHMHTLVRFLVVCLLLLALATAAATLGLPHGL